jgi:hypothetical protein
VIVEINKLLQEEVVDKLDVFVVGQVHPVFLSMIVYRMIRGPLQAEKTVYVQAVRGRGASPANPLD